MVELVVEISKSRGSGARPQLSLRVLDAAETTIACSPRECVGSRLLVNVSVPVTPGSCVAIDSDDALILGEVLGCWQEGSEICGVIKLEHRLHSLSHLRSIQANNDNLSVPALNVTQSLLRNPHA
jgi:hypothetical protein